MARGWLQDAGGGEAGSKRTKGVDDEWTDNLNKRNSTFCCAVQVHRQKLMRETLDEHQSCVTVKATVC